jgi:hypothetical protein
MLASNHPLETDLLKFCRYNGIRKEKFYSKYFIYFSSPILIGFEDYGYVTLSSVPGDGYNVAFKCYTLDLLFKKAFEYQILKPVPHFNSWVYPPYPKGKKVNLKRFKSNESEKSDHAILRANLKRNDMQRAHNYRLKKFRESGQLEIQFEDSICPTQQLNNPDSQSQPSFAEQKMKRINYARFTKLNRM